MTKAWFLNQAFLDLTIALFTSDDNDMGGMGDIHRSIHNRSDDKCRMKPMVERRPEVELRKLAVVVHNMVVAERTREQVVRTWELGCRHQ
jgi:hypothetical protein